MSLIFGGIKFFNLFRMPTDLDILIAILLICGFQSYFSFITIPIYTSTIKSPSAVQMSKSIKQTQSVDKVHYNTHV